MGFFLVVFECIFRCFLAVFVVDGFLGWPCGECIVVSSILQFML